MMTRFRQALMLGLVALIVAGLVPAAGAATSSNVAYVFDFGTGANDPGGPGIGSSIFVNALTGVAPGVTYTSSGPSPVTITITNVPVSAIDLGGVAVLTPEFNTVILYQICDIGSHPATIAAINAYLTAGAGKVMIFDADRCATGTPAGPANYSAFLFPFTTKGPGPFGPKLGLPYTAVVPSTLTTGLNAGSPPPEPPGDGDAIEDSNPFVTFDGHWCGTLTARNEFLVNGVPTPGNVGFVEAYARTPAGGLVVYEGEDFWFTYGHEPHLKLVFDLMLEQQFKPDGLPQGPDCPIPASGISLAPPTQTVTVGSPATVTAKVVDISGTGRPGIAVTFKVMSGPDAPLSGPGTSPTDASGNASFTFTCSAFGTDVVQASFVDTLGNTHFSNTVTVICNAPPVALCKNVTVSTDPGTCSAVSASVNNGSFDPDGDPITLVQTPAGPYALGTTPVTLTVTDSHGASSQCRATVTVVDKEPPKITCPAAITRECTGPTGTDVSVVPSASDNCGAVTANCSPSGPFPVGSTTVTCTATDTAHNTSRCSTNVTVVDTTPPVVTCERVGKPRGKDKERDDDRERRKYREAKHEDDDDDDGAFFRVSASDVCSAPKLTIGGITLANGETIGIKQSHKPGVRLGETEHGVRQFKVGPGQAVITATDAAGNAATAVCPVPPKGRDDDKDKDRDDENGKRKGGHDD